MIDQYLKPNVKRGALYYAIISLVLGILMLIPLLNCLVAPLACLIGTILPFATGWFVAQWGRTMPSTATPLAVQSTSPYAAPAVDGAVATGVGSLVSGIIVWIIGTLFGGIFAAMGAAAGGSTGSEAVGTVIGAAGGIFGVIIGVIVAAIFGAVGAAIYVAYTSRNTAPIPPSAPPPPVSR